jgi:hypothetical protein
MWGTATSRFAIDAERREFRDSRMEGKAMLNLAELDAVRGDIPAALDRGREAIAVLEDTQDEWLLERARLFSIETSGKATDVSGAGHRPAPSPERPTSSRGRFRRSAQLAPPLGRLFRLAPGLIELDDPIGSLGQPRLRSHRDPALAGLHAFVTGKDQRLGLGKLPLAHQAAAEQ